MSDQTLSRRAFLEAGTTLAGAAWLRALAPAAASLAASACGARDGGRNFVILGADEARDFSAIAARIIPTTDTPGATEAGVIHFFDQAFAKEMIGTLPFARDGLRELNESVYVEHFWALDDTDQDQALAAIEGEPFFELMRALTIFGFFAMSKYGGNRDYVAWELIGFDGHRGAWQYPFGDYDAAVHGGPDETDGE
ncbi:MAG: gluconate 2-dehydrogenase subunit 3 family protein [Woeseiaceae bacterium]|nr:gluconate 2-dehydrogenase subunit 3 family protein [Woeseiaceae bacterium]